MRSSFFQDLKQEFQGYNAARLGRDLMAGLTVCAVALPLAVGVALCGAVHLLSGLLPL